MPRGIRRYLLIPVTAFALAMCLPGAAYATGPVGNQYGSGTFFSGTAWCTAYWALTESPEQTPTSPVTSVQELDGSLSVSCPDGNYSGIAMEWYHEYYNAVDGLNVLGNPAGDCYGGVYWAPGPITCTAAVNPQPGQWTVGFIVGDNGLTGSPYWTSGSLTTYIL